MTQTHLDPSAAEEAGTADLSSKCRVCGHGTPARTHVVREMMYGTRQPFRYTECARCGSLSLREVPADLGRFYPSDYYSFSTKPDAGIKRRLKRVRARHALGLSSPLGALLCRLWGRPPFVDAIGSLGLSFDAPILDVGTGRGDLLRQMACAGFTHLTGVDPYLPSDMVEPGLQVLRGSLERVTGEFACIMFNHSFEHMDEPATTLARARARLASRGAAVLRTPVAGRAAWREYGVDWVQLDAPRHLFLPTEEGIRGLAAEAHLRIDRIVYESSGFQFWGSELYRRDIALIDKARAGWTQRDYARFDAMATQLNRQQDGDQAMFYLSRA